jgi:hypothetical protein
LEPIAFFANTPGQLFYQSLSITSTWDKNITIMYFTSGQFTPADCNKSNYLSYDRVTSDPNGTEYPDDLLPYSLVTSWMTPWISKMDLPNKLANEVKLELAPSYVNPEFEAIDFGE